MAQLRFGDILCNGVMSTVNPSRPCAVCLYCERRTTPPQHAWQKYLDPAPAVHDGQRWVCDKRVSVVAYSTTEKQQP